MATARTCYSSKIIWPHEVDENDKRRQQRDMIAASIYKAGHHTTLQHAHFQFILDGVSRQLIWSFLHAHPFYNSEQVSQRYVEVKPGNFYVPDRLGRAQKIYIQALNQQMQDYQDLIRVLAEPTTKQYLKIFPKRNLSEKKWRNAIKKRSMEIARYVLPIGTCAHLYHTISGITLHRYNRLCNQLDVPFETKQVVQKMVEEVNKVDPLFFKNIEDTLPLEETLEYQVLEHIAQRITPEDKKDFLNEFDLSLDHKTSKLIGFSQNAEEILAASVRTVLGVAKNKLSDQEALGFLLNPDKNHYLAQALNLNTMSKLMRCLNHCHFTFRKKISHTADSQDQRHRMTPGSRPVIASHFLINQPDFITPDLIKTSQEAVDLYHQSMHQAWQRISDLLEMGVALEDALYILPNAFPIRFEESGDLMAFHHKWTTRLCYTAQEEIWNNCRDEVLQVSEIFPKIGKWLHPPCTLRRMAKETPYCPEGDRFCGVRVWKLEVDEFERLL